MQQQDSLPPPAAAAVQPPAPTAHTSSNSADPDLDAALGAAARRGDVAAVRRLLSQGAAINAADAEGRTALHRATTYGRLEAARVLLAHGANVHARDAWGRQPLQIAAADGRQELAVVLLNAGAAVGGESVKRACSSALQTAIRSKNASMVRVLVQNGVGPNDPNAAGGGDGDGGVDMLESAVKQSSAEVVEVLLQAGAVSREGRLGVTNALQSSSTFNHPHMVRVLLRHSKQQPTPEGLESLLYYALSRRSHDVAAQLLLQLERQQRSAARMIPNGWGMVHDPTALRMAMLKGWASDTGAVDAGHAAAAAQEVEVAEQRAGLRELVVGFGTVPDRLAEQEREGGGG